MVTTMITVTIITTEKESGPDPVPGGLQEMIRHKPIFFL